MASLYPKKVSGKTYWYLREMGRVDGKPKMISERYLGTAADIAAAVDRAEAVMLPERTRHLAFGDVAAGWAGAGPPAISRGRSSAAIIAPPNDLGYRWKLRVGTRIRDQPLQKSCANRVPLRRKLSPNNL